MNPAEYPYSLSRRVEAAFLQELAAITGILLWRADEIEQCAKEYRDRGVISVVTGHSWYTREVQGPDRLFGEMEGFLAAWARASLILYPTAKTAAARGRHLRAVLRLDDGWTGMSVKNRDLRNGWMHLDEDLDAWAAARAGAVSRGEFTGEHASAYHKAVGGAIRVISAEPPSVLLPERGAWDLRPFFHDAKDLDARVARTIQQKDRWVVHRGVEGLLVGWGGRPQHWEIRSLGGGVAVAAHGQTPVGARAAFRREVDLSLGS